MIIQDVLDLARYSELNSLAIKDNTPALMLFLNAGMLELHKKFPIKVEEHIINLQDAVTDYPLPDDYMYVLEAFGEVDENYPLDGPVKIPINDECDPKSIFLPNHKTVQVPLVTTGAVISLIYVAKPIRYDEDDLAEELDLPEALIDCLIHYMGYRAHSGIKGDSNSENNAHFLRFEQCCDKARELGVAHPLDSWSMPTRLFDRGFV